MARLQSQRRGRGPSGGVGPPKQPEVVHLEPKNEVNLAGRDEILRLPGSSHPKAE